MQLFMGQWRNINIHFNWLLHKALNKSLKCSIAGWVFWRIDWNIFRKKLINSGWQDNKGKWKISEACPTAGLQQMGTAICCSPTVQGRQCVSCESNNESVIRAPIFNKEANLLSTPRPPPRIGGKQPRGREFSFLWIKRAIQWTKAMKSSGKKRKLSRP